MKLSIQTNGPIALLRNVNCNKDIITSRGKDISIDYAVILTLGKLNKRNRFMDCLHFPVVLYI